METPTGAYKTAIGGHWSRCGRYLCGLADLLRRPFATPFSCRHEPNCGNWRIHIHYFCKYDLICCCPCPYSPTFALSILFALSRSPWSNAYDPALPDGATPSPKLRELEVSANDAFDVYRELCVNLPPFSEFFGPGLPLTFAPFLSRKAISRVECPLSICGTLTTALPA